MLLFSSSLSKLYKLLLIGVLSTTFYSNLLLAKPNFSIKVRVNDDIITNYDIDQRLKLFDLLNIKLNEPEFDIKKILIDEKLQQQYSKSLNIALSNQEVDLELVRFLQNVDINKTKLLSILKKNNISLKTLKEHLKHSKLWKKTLLEVFGNMAKITEYELNSPAEQLLGPIQEKLNLSEIVIPFAERGEKNSLLLAKRLYLELNAGNDFEVAAKRFSRSKSASTGGDLGFIDRKLLPERFLIILDTMSVNQISEPIINGQTVVLLKLLSKKNENGRNNIDYLITFSEFSEEILNGTKQCKELRSVKLVPTLLSKLSKDKSKVLRLTNLFEPKQLSKKKWIVLCSRQISDDSLNVRLLKNKYFNKNITILSNKLMSKLYREALVQ